ncbi:Uncharacterised protein [uncultured archaeon]|nr:Uncharacterised protein [uncultured archaeon]
MKTGHSLGSLQIAVVENPLQSTIPFHVAYIELLNQSAGAKGRMHVAERLSRWFAVELGLAVGGAPGKRDLLEL